MFQPIKRGVQTRIWKPLLGGGKTVPTEPPVFQSSGETFRLVLENFLNGGIPISLGWNFYWPRLFRNWKSTLDETINFYGSSEHGYLPPILDTEPVETQNSANFWYPGKSRSLEPRTFYEENVESEYRQVYEFIVKELHIIYAKNMRDNLSQTRHEFFWKNRIDPFRSFKFSTMASWCGKVFQRYSSWKSELRLHLLWSDRQGMSTEIHFLCFSFKIGWKSLRKIVPIENSKRILWFRYWWKIPFENTRKVHTNSEWFR